MVFKPSIRYDTFNDKIVYQSIKVQYAPIDPGKYNYKLNISLNEDLQ
jgi:hypothetical protein